jgi:hypothetical protein
MTPTSRSDELPPVDSPPLQPVVPIGAGPIIPGTAGERIGSRVLDRWLLHRANVVRAALATLTTAAFRHAGRS